MMTCESPTAPSRQEASTRSKLAGQRSNASSSVCKTTLGPRPIARRSTTSAETAPCPAPHHLLAGMASSVSAQEPDDERDCLGAIPVPMSGGDNQWLQFTANVAPVRAAYAATFGIVTTNFSKGEVGKIHRMTMKYCLGCEPSNRKVCQLPRPVVSCSA